MFLKKGYEIAVEEGNRTIFNNKRNEFEIIRQILLLANNEIKPPPD
jgi:hypothetical protein